MNDKKREALDLRAIKGSTKAALAKSEGDDDRQRIKTTSDELLARLEKSVLLDGADPEMIEDVDQARRHVWD